MGALPAATTSIRKPPISPSRSTRGKRLEPRPRSRHAKARTSSTEGNQPARDRAADCLADDLDRCLTFYQFPEPHWSHLRTTNVIESPFAGVRLRTNAAKRFKKTKSGVYLVHQVLLRLSRTWRHLNAAHLCGQLPLPQAKTSRAKRRSQAA